MEKLLAKVNYVLDSDTISVQASGRTFISRCKWIDSPETKKPNQLSDNPLVLNHWTWGDRSRQLLSQIIQPGRSIIIYNYDVDQYGRNLSDWYLNSSSLKNNLQYQLISQGLACPFLPFNKYDFSSRELSLYLGIFRNVVSAYKNGFGFWADYKLGKFILPYDFKTQFKF